MKQSICILLLCTLTVNLAEGQKSTIPSEIKYKQLSDSIKCQLSKIDSLALILINIENKKFKTKEFLSENFYSYSGALIETTSLLFTIFLAVIGFITFFRFKTLKKSIDEKIREISQNAKEVNQVKKAILTNQSFLRQAVDQYSLVFNILVENLNRKKTKQYLQERIFEIQSIINLYSPDKSDRFASITNLYGRGTSESLEHLNNLINNPNEEKDLVLLALRAINIIEERQ
jgi:hypothetical protein